MIRLKGIAWDHVRGYEPLKTTAKQFGAENPDVVIEWDVRSLTDFGNYPIELLVDKYDLILLDHPFVGTGAHLQKLVPLDQWIPADYLKNQEEHSVGLSYSSYQWGGQLWALAIDAAAQSAAYRPDLLLAYTDKVPRSWEDVFQLAASLPNELKIGLPLVPTDAACSFISMMGNMGGYHFWNEHTGIDPQVGVEALALLQKLLPVLHPKSWEMNPIEMLDWMSSRNEIAYVPLIFGYSNYAKDGFAPHIVRFADVPSTHRQPAGSLLGGVGLGVSAQCQHIGKAVDYVMFVASEQTQCGEYFHSGGQPGHRAAWMDERINAASNGFFRDTIQTLDLAYMRPRHPGYNDFQILLGDRVHLFLKNGGDRREFMAEINRLYLDCKSSAMQ